MPRLAPYILVSPRASITAVIRVPEAGALGVSQGGVVGRVSGIGGRVEGGAKEGCNMSFGTDGSYRSYRSYRSYGSYGSYGTHEPHVVRLRERPWLVLHLRNLVILIEEHADDVVAGGAGGTELREV